MIDGQTAKVTLNLRNGDQIRVVFKVLPKTVFDGIIGGDFLRDYEVVTSKGRLEHMFTGQRIPISLERLSSELNQEWVEFSANYSPHRLPLTKEPEISPKIKQTLEVETRISKQVSFESNQPEYHSSFAKLESENQQSVESSYISQNIDANVREMRNLANLIFVHRY